MTKTPFFIHIGTWKTGSSTIQFNLHTVKSELEREGIFYLSKSDKMVVDDAVIRSFTELNHDYILASRKKLSAILERKRALNPAMRFIASAEEFSGDPFSGFENSGEVARNVFEITKDLNLDIKIIVYLRRQDDFIESLYTQSIHLGGHKTFDEFISDFNEDAFHWDKLLNSYAGVFGKENIIVKRYHKSFLPENDSLIKEFGTILNSNVLMSFNKTNPRNRGISRDALEITRITNQYLNSEDQYLLRSIFQESNAKQPFESYAYMDSERRKSYLKRFSKSNALVSNAYFGDAIEKLFPEDDIEHQNYLPYNGLTSDAVALNLSKSIVTLHKKLKRLEDNLQHEIKKTGIRYKIKKALSRLIKG